MEQAVPRLSGRVMPGITKEPQRNYCSRRRVKERKSEPSVAGMLAWFTVNWRATGELEQRSSMVWLMLWKDHPASVL